MIVANVAMETPRHVESEGLSGATIVLWRKTDKILLDAGDE
jgi:hypothetical protein